MTLVGSKTDGRWTRRALAALAVTLVVLLAPPQAVAQDSRKGRIDVREGQVVLGGISEYARELVKARRIIFLGQGTALHAAMIGRTVRTLAGPARDYRLQLWCAPDAQHPLLRRLAEAYGLSLPFGGMCLVFQ